MNNFTTEMLVHRENDDGLLRAIFPEEVWALVLDELTVTSPGDLENVSNSSPFFRRLLDSKKVQFLFPKAIDILLTTKYLLRMNSKNTQFLEEEPVNGSEGSVLDKKAKKLLKLRLVCKMWKMSIDRFYEEKLFTGNSKDVLYGTAFEETFLPGILNPPQNDEPTILAFLAHFNISHGTGDSTCNPFVSRGCEFIFPKSGHQEQPLLYEHQVSRLLRTYGHHLHKCTFNFIKGNDFEAYHSHLREWLGLVPNLKKLEIVSRVYPSVTAEEMSGIEQAYTLNPFPTMDTLESLVLDNVKYPFNAYLLEASSQLSHLALNMYSMCPNWPTPLYPFTLTQVLQNLTHLKMVVYHQRDFEGLEASRFNPGFHSLELIFHFVPYRSRKLFRLLGKLWGDSLKNLSLLMLRYRKDGNSAARGRTFCRNCSRYRRMYLPQVTTFKVEVKFPTRRYYIGPSFNYIDDYYV